MGKPGSITVRAASLDDVEGIRAIHAGCDDPWSHPGIGPVWLNHRLLRGFIVDVATLGDQIVGHAEWNVSDEPDPFGRSLYLGMIQVHEDYQRKGIGSAMVAAGMAKARALSCHLLKTIPDAEACGFYQKCGFAPVTKVFSVDVPATAAGLPKDWVRVGRVPQSVIASLPLRLGWCGQASSAFMWEICNRPIQVAGEHNLHPCARSGAGNAYVQLRHTGGEGALAVAWARSLIPISELVEAALYLAQSMGVAVVTASVLEAESSALSALAEHGISTQTEVWARQVLFG